MTYHRVALHSCGGSMGEAVMPVWTGIFENAKDAEVIEDYLNDSLEERDYWAVTDVVEDPMTVEMAKADIAGQYFWEDMEDHDPDAVPVATVELLKFSDIFDVRMAIGEDGKLK